MKKYLQKYKEGDIVNLISEDTQLIILGQFYSTDYEEHRYSIVNYIHYINDMPRSIGSAREDMIELNKLYYRKQKIRSLLK